jgi:hypothetical protein
MISTVTAEPPVKYAVILIAFSWLVEEPTAPLSVVNATVGAPTAVPPVSVPAVVQDNVGAVGP